ncbi:MAG: hypothetical protein GTN68_02360 [Candidatus Aminicenantes bacterium]|nr:hypothetical protein [Candidatus Aminicenantes bacterium]
MLKCPKVLEVGIGTGKNIKYYPENVWVVGVDLSEGMMAKARPIVLVVTFVSIYFIYFK